MYMRTVVSDLLGAMAAKPLLALGMSHEQAQVLAAKARNDMKNPWCMPTSTTESGPRRRRREGSGRQLTH